MYGYNIDVQFMHYSKLDKKNMQEYSHFQILYEVSLEHGKKF